MTGTISDEISNVVYDISRMKISALSRDNLSGVLERFVLRIQVRILEDWKAANKACLGNLEFTDEQITNMARELTANLYCRRTLQVTNSHVAGICSGTLKYENGKVHMSNVCGTPCDFVCHTAAEFQKHVWTILSVTRAFNNCQVLQK